MNYEKLDLGNAFFCTTLVYTGSYHLGLLGPLAPPPPHSLANRVKVEPP